jgi:hypothetical protein
VRHRNRLAAPPRFSELTILPLQAAFSPALRRRADEAGRHMPTTCGGALVCAPRKLAS